MTAARSIAGSTHVVRLVVRHRWEGELGDDGYKTVTGQIDELLAERTPKGR